MATIKDEFEAVHENSELYRYFKEIGIVNSEELNGSIIFTEDLNEEKPTTFSTAYEWQCECLTYLRRLLNWQDISYLHDAVECILESMLMIREDSHYVEYILSQNVLQHRHKGSAASNNYTPFLLFGVMCIFSCLPLKLMLGTVIILATIFGMSYVWRMIHNFCMKKKLKKLRQLLFIQNEMILLVKKTLCLLRARSSYTTEAKICTMGSLFQSSRVDKSGFLEQFNTIPMLRNCLLETVLNVTKYVHMVTNNVIETVPLHSQVDNTQSYLCSCNWSSLELEEFFSNSDGSITIEMLQRLTSLYIIMQSEFLRRLSLSLCPETMEKCTRKAANTLWDTIENVSWEITRNSFRLMKHYWLCCGYEKQSSIVPKILKQKHIPYQRAELFQTFQELFLTSQEISNSVSFCIKQTEPKFVTVSEDNHSGVEVCEELEEVMIELAKLLKKSNSQFEICFKKLMKMCNYQSSEAKQGNAEFIKESEDEGCEILHVGYNDVNPQVEDEVFEEVISSDFQISDDEPDSSMIIEETKNKIWKKHYDVLFSELKNVLSVRAEKVKEREAKALQKRKIQIQECSNSPLLCDSAICGSNPDQSNDHILLSKPQAVYPNQTVVFNVKKKVSDLHVNFLKIDNNVTKLNPESDHLLMGSLPVTDVSEKCYDNRNSSIETMLVKLPVHVSRETVDVSQFTNVAYNRYTKQLHNDERTILSEASSLCTVDSFLAESDEIKEEKCAKSENSSVSESSVQRLGIRNLLGFPQNTTKLMEETFSYDPVEES